MEAIRLQIIIPFHLPLSASDSDIEEACARCYVPLLDAIEGHNSVSMTLHFTGHMLDFLSHRDPELLTRVKRMVKAGQVEVLGGLFYGGAPALMPEMDVRGQIQMMSEFWESFLGEAPTGFWAPDLAWAREMPRLLDETGLAYGFVSSSQLSPSKPHPPPLGVMERGGLGIAAFVLNAGLSSALPAAAPDEWIGAVLDAAGPQEGRLVSVWVRAESLGLEPGAAKWCLEQGWLEQWLEALGTRGAEIDTVLPSASFAALRPAVPLKLRPGVASELSALGKQAGPVDWIDFPVQFAEADTLYRKTLRASEKLRLFIATMEEEGLEDDWSDALATAQRLVFAAQATDALWRGPKPGFTDPKNRDAVCERLCKAETMMDALVQGEDDWIAAEEEDRDADLQDEVFVANRHLSAWLVPAKGGSVRVLDDRATGRNVLDAGNRRSEPFYAEMTQADLGTADAERELPIRRGVNLQRLAADLPAQADDVERMGIREWLLDVDAQPNEFFSGALRAATQETPTTEILNNQIDEEGDCTYALDLRTKLSLAGMSPRTATIEKTVSVPIDAAELTLAYKISLEGEGGALLAVEMPFRLGVEGMKVTSGFDSVELAERTCPDVTSLLLTDDGGRVSIDIDPALDVWLMPLRTTLRDLAGYRPSEQGVLLVPVIRVEREATAIIKIKLG